MASTMLRSQGQQQRSVRFAEMATMYLVPRWEDDTKKEMWWLPGDQAKMKQDAKQLARDQRRRTNLPDYVNQAYDWAREVSSETKGEASLVQRLRGLPVHRSLSTWSSGNHGLRGLERFVSRVANFHMKKNALAKSKFRFLERAEVLDDESIRFLAEKESRTSRVFARMMGMADATAAAACYSEFDYEDYEELQSFDDISLVQSDDDLLSLPAVTTDMSIDLESSVDPLAGISPLRCIAAGRAA